MRKQRKTMNRISFGGILICVVMAFFVSNIAGDKKGQKEEAKPTPQATAQPTAAATEKPAPVSWELVLVNRENPIDEDFVPQLEAVAGEQIDKRIYKAFTDMTAAAQKAGIELVLCSGYRDRETQNKLFEDQVRKWRESGLGPEASVAKTQEYLQPPGASEHHTGLAVDLLSSGFTSMDESFAETEAYAWLKEHCTEYGFIERYIKDKESITGVKWEPWHYRYVGPENAKKIAESGKCLEELT